MLISKIAQCLRESYIFQQFFKSTSEWRGFESRWFYQSGFEFAKTPLPYTTKIPCTEISRMRCEPPLVLVLMGRVCESVVDPFYAHMAHVTS